MSDIRGTRTQGHPAIVAPAASQEAVFREAEQNNRLPFNLARTPPGFGRLQRQTLADRKPRVEWIAIPQ